MALCQKFEDILRRIDRANRNIDAERAWEEMSRFAVENAEDIALGLNAIDELRERAAKGEISLAAGHGARGSEEERRG